MISTDEGIQIALSEEHDANADSPRSDTSEPLSNVTDETVWQEQQHPDSIR
jgi:hypothetical protein